MTLEAFIFIVIVVVALYRLWAWVRVPCASPDPWGPEVEAALQSAEAVPVCPHCQAPQEHEGWFCPQCGATVGPYSNYLPSVYIFSIGEACRGVFSSQLRFRPLLLLGYFLALLGFAPILLPVALYYLLKSHEPAPRDPHLAA